MNGTFQFELFDDPANRVLATTTYEEFRRRLNQSDCRRCSLAAGRSNIVIDRGNPGSKLLVVGEGPGQQEDEQGKAFVGRAGQLLDEIMKAVGLDTNRDMLIANVVKCRPPNNRAPQADEAKACLPYLSKQISMMAPSCILLLGATAAKYLIPEKRDIAMNEEAGRFFTAHDYPGIRFMILYHPAFLLRDPRKKKDMWAHIKMFQQWWSAQG